MDISMKIWSNQVKHSWSLHQLPNSSAVRNPNYQGSRTQPQLSGQPHATPTIGAATRNPNLSGQPHATLTIGAVARNPNY